MQVSSLYNLHSGEDIYIIGSGPSFSVFPISFFENKITIGLNRSWENYVSDYSITIHPDKVIPEFNGGNSINTKWITNFKKCKLLLKQNHYEYAINNYYNFNYYHSFNTAAQHDPSNSGRNLNWLDAPSEDNLYVWSSIVQTGINLAANMGAKNIILVGCDFSDISGVHHSSDESPNWKGVSPDYRYNQYLEGTIEVSEALSKRGINIVSLSPFFGISNFKEQFIQKSNNKLILKKSNNQEEIFVKDNFFKSFLKRLIAHLNNSMGR